MTKNTPNIPIVSNQKLIADIWRYFIDLQCKVPKNVNEKYVAKDIHCNSYWYALRNIFVKYSSPLLKIKASNIKMKKIEIENSIKYLDGLLKFFFLKKER